MSAIIGAITVGQSPRPDISEEVKSILGPDVTIIEGGALDGLTKEDVDKFAPSETDNKLTSFLKDGTEVIFAEYHIIPFIQQRINELEAAGAELIMMYCAGEFPDSLVSKVPLIYPRRILEANLHALAYNKKAAVLAVPDLLREWTEIWQRVRDDVLVIPCSPYLPLECGEIEKAAEIVSEQSIDFVIMDCISFTGEMQEIMMRKTGANVICARRFLAHTVAALLNK